MCRCDREPLVVWLTFVYAMSWISISRLDEKLSFVNFTHVFVFFVLSSFLREKTYRKIDMWYYFKYFVKIVRSSWVHRGFFGGDRIANIFSFLCCVLYLFALFFCDLCLMYPMLSVSLDCPLMIAPLFFCDMCLIYPMFPVSLDCPLMIAPLFFCDPCLMYPM